MEYNVQVKDYPFFAEAKSISEAKDKIRKVILRKKRLFKDYVNVPLDKYTVTERG